MASLRRVLFKFAGHSGETPGFNQFDELLKLRLARLESVVAERAWLSRSYSIADIAVRRS